MYIFKIITNRDIEENLYSDVNFVRTVYKLLFNPFVLTTFSRFYPVSCPWPFSIISNVSLFLNF